MAKENPLAQGLKHLSNPQPSLGLQTELPKQGTTKSRSSTRDGLTLIGGFFAPEVHRQLKILAAESGVTQQALLAEALNMLFAKNSKPEIANLDRILSDK